MYSLIQSYLGGEEGGVIFGLEVWHVSQIPEMHSSSSVDDSFFRTLFSYRPNNLIVHPELWLMDHGPSLRRLNKTGDLNVCCIC